MSTTYEHTKGLAQQMSTTIRSALALLLMMMLGVGELWAATKDFDLPNGYYYLGNEAGSNSVASYDGSNFAANFYMCPAYNTTKNENNYLGGDENKPLITTLKSFSKNGKTYMWAIWYIEAATGVNEGYFYIRHQESEQYLVANDNETPGPTRRRVNLGPTTKPEGNDGLFRIQSNDNGNTYYIYPKEKLVVDKNGDNKYLSPSNGNKDFLNAQSPNSNTGGILGLWYENDKNSAWHFVNAQCIIPIVHYNPATDELTLTSDTGATIYYTIDGDNPPTSGTEGKYNDSSKPKLKGGKVVKAIATKTNKVNSEVMTQTIVVSPVVSTVESVTYSGSAQEPTVTVKDGETIIPVEEYEVSYSNNTDAGTATATVINRNGGSYFVVNSSTTFTILKASISPTVSIDGWTYGEAASTPTVEGNIGGGVVTYEYKASDAVAYSTTVPSDAGDYIVRAIIAESSNCDGATTDPYAFTISPKTIGDGTTAAEGITVEMTEDGLLSAVKDGSTTLVENTDYTQETVEDGSDKIITITGMGNYTGGARGIYANPKFDDPDGDGGSGQAAAVYQAKRDLSCPTGIKPYIIRKVNPSIGTAVITKLDYIPEDVPVLLLSDDEASGFVASPKDPSTPEVTAQTKNSNLLKVSAGGETVGAAQIYMFYKGEFVLTKAGTLGEGKFYLYNPNYANTSTSGNSGSSEARGTLQFIIDDEDTTGITEFETSTTKKQDTDVWYTLDGRRLSVKPSKAGIYIHQGQKEYIKR
jgi:hypothetical protein